MSYLLHVFFLTFTKSPQKPSLCLIQVCSPQQHWLKCVRAPAELMSLLVLVSSMMVPSWLSTPRSAWGRMYRLSVSSLSARVYQVLGNIQRCRWVCESEKPSTVECTLTLGLTSVWNTHLHEPLCWRHHNTQYIECCVLLWEDYNLIFYSRDISLLIFTMLSLQLIFQIFPSVRNNRAK